MNLRDKTRPSNSLKCPPNSENQDVSKDEHPDFCLRNLETKMTRLVLMIDDGQANAVECLAKREYRTTWQQAALIIRQELERRGFVG